MFSVIGKEITVKVDALPLERFTVLFNNNRYHFPTWTTHFALHENNQWLPVGPSEKLEGIGVPAQRMQLMKGSISANRNYISLFGCFSERYSTNIGMLNNGL